MLLSNAENGLLEAVLDAGAVTALRTGAAAVLAAETLGRPDAETRGGDRRGRQRRAPPRGRSPRVAATVFVWDVDEERARAAAEELGGGRRRSRDEALAADLVVTVTPGHEVLLARGSLRPGQHVSLMGADGPGKAEIAVAELARAHVFCDDWEQASHSGELAARRRGRRLERDDVTELGAVLAGEAEGRRTHDEITVFDSTGLAIQDLAIAIAALGRSGRARSEDDRSLALITAQARPNGRASLSPRYVLYRKRTTRSR